MIVGERCILVPYRKEHVPRYHEWMQDPHLLESTGSDPLSLESEYEMQESWRDDDQKCTFIVADRQKMASSGIDLGVLASHNGVVPSNFIVDSLSAMVGDVNLFFSEFEESDDEIDQVDSASAVQCKNKNEPTPTKPPLQAEIDIMVAESSSRGKGIGREAVLLMMGYAQKHLPVVRFFCKINADNRASRSLFETKLGFRECDFAGCFQQYEYEQKQQSGGEDWDAFGTLQEQGTLVKVYSCPLSSTATS